MFDMETEVDNASPSGCLTCSTKWRNGTSAIDGAQRRQSGTAGERLMIPQEIASTLSGLFRQEKRSLVNFLQGPPGIGKTAVVGQAAKTVSKELRIFALPTCESVDLPRTPSRREGRDKVGEPVAKRWRRRAVAGRVVDAAPDVQVAAHHLVHAEPGSDMSLPAGWHLCSPGSRRRQDALPRELCSLCNRLVVINAEPERKAVAERAMNNQISPTVVRSLRLATGVVGREEIPSEGAFPSPRSWEAASRVIELGLGSAIERERFTDNRGRRDNRIRRLPSHRA